jgi:hypothetical protein
MTETAMAAEASDRPNGDRDCGLRAAEAMAAIAGLG